MPVQGGGLERVLVVEADAALASSLLGALAETAVRWCAPAALEEALQISRAALSDKPEFAGLAVHDWASYRLLE